MSGTESNDRNSTGDSPAADATKENEEKEEGGGGLSQEVLGSLIGGGFAVLATVLGALLHTRNKRRAKGRVEPVAPPQASSDELLSTGAAYA